MRFLSLFLIPLLLMGKNYESLMNHYKDGEYKKSCIKGIKLLRRGEKNEQVLSLIGDACAKADYIDILGDIQKYQRKTTKARENASYFTTILAQKRLIFQFMFDNLELDNLKFPQTNHIISKVFTNLSRNNFTIKQNIPKRVLIKDGNEKYLLYTHKNKIYIEETTNQTMIKHRYR